MTAWWLYPKENHFSLMTCTISFLGSPDADRNPPGWRFYQAGMTALILLVFSLVRERHYRLQLRIGRAATLSSTAIFIALALLLLAVWIPDTRQGHWFGMRTTEFHTRMALLAFPILALGIAGAVATFGSITRASGVAAQYDEAALLAERRLTEVDAMDPSTVTQDSGDFGEDFPGWTWEQELVAVDTTAATDTDTSELQELRVTVRWKDGNRDRSLVVSTYLLQPAAATTATSTPAR